MYTSSPAPPYPFPTLFKPMPEDGIPELLSCLPATEELLEYLDFFEKRVHLCAFPHIPMEITREEVGRFLSDRRKNAQMCPDMLALLFAALALGSQYSTWDRSGGQWKAETMKAELQRGNVYSECSTGLCAYSFNGTFSRSSHASATDGLIHAQTISAGYSSTHHDRSLPN